MIFPVATSLTNTTPHTQMTPAAYDLADQLHAAAPWHQIMEYNLIALIDPTTGEKHHISLMGANGEHFALALYLGESARRRFNTMQETRLPEEDRTRLILETPQLQCSFDERSELMKSELAAIKASGKKYRGTNWPSFRRFQPGFSPTPVNQQELDLLCLAIQQTLEVTNQPDFTSDTITTENGITTILTRRYNGTSWVTEHTPDIAELAQFPIPTPSEFSIAKVLRHPKCKPLDIAFRLMPTPIGRSREQSVFPYILLVVEPQSGMILGFELISAEKTDYTSMPIFVVDALLQLLDKNKICPTHFQVASPITAILLHNTAQALNATIDVMEHLPTLDQAIDDIMGHMMR